MTIRITGTGSALPEKIVTNFDLAELVETSDEWIKERTGISERRISTGETVAELSAKACRQALENAGKSAEEVELIIVATCSPEMALPCAACQVQSMIDAPKAVCFDLNAACSGFLFALCTANAYIQSGIYKNALIVGAEVLSKMMDWQDRSTCVLFGDGAGAVFVESGDGAGILSQIQGSDGYKGEVLSCVEREVKNPFIETNDEKEGTSGAGYVQMNGQEVYRFATRKVPDCIKEALEQANLSVEDIDLFVLHQANVRIIEAAAKRLKADIQKFPVNVNRVGNMSSATIPVLLDEIHRNGTLKRGMKIVLSGFGAGLTYGACVMEW